MLLLPPPLPPSFPAANFTSSRHSQLTTLPRRMVAPPPAASNEVDTFTQYSGYLFELSSSEAESLNEYKISKIAAIYQKKPLILLRRLFQTATTLGRWFALRYYDRITERADAMFEVRAAELRKILAQLGPAYIKIAQAISSRPDLIPPSYLDELSLLQDRIAPFSTEVAFDIIERELGLPIDALFSEISPEPVAAASLGQVYQARLRSSGKVVALKVQRPGVRAAISLDILILRFLAGVIRRAGKLNTDLQEMDYIKEANNGVKFRQLYGNIKDVVVPEMYIEQTTGRVLTMQWVEGQKLVEVKDLYMIEVGVYCSFNQLLEYGFYHADPHPGNLLRTYDGKLAYLDFGMMGEFKQELRDGFIEACLHLVNRDYDALANDFVTLGLLPPTADKEAVTNALTGVFRDAVAKGVRNISFGDLLGNLGTTMYKYKFRIPSYFSLVIRSLAVLEGIAISSDPDYKVLGNTYPWIARKVLTDSSPKLKSSLQALLYKDGVFRIDRFESLLAESLRARTERALVGKQVEDESKRIIKQVLSFTLDEKGAFVREILLDELAKGLDALGAATLDSLTSMTANLPFRTSSTSSMTNEDIANLRTLRRLMLLVSELQRTETSAVGVKEVGSYDIQKQSSDGAALLPYGLEYAQEMLPLISAIAELPQDSQQQLLRLPADLAGKLVSRVAARTLRRAFL
ncbi:Protein kinase superfamily protein [Perilla frutescens var. hirtella]|uniref:Protein kinase superfamily protein n=1 Tax=Perilla frutescens var. hirtella TaxID=608512 RepID=A0AAD4PDB3_PERFH|nr:Protein kinase superfamily protein [Perilla frutescens var. frutescens]KAH6786688.1 Protein kinase superfamily protein [Perilla frutescens var. hirtella]KAH6834717.1 Protein kinase superfamily protein [Perilla frutescens var. hirtella]